MARRTAIVLALLLGIAASAQAQPRVHADAALQGTPAPVAIGGRTAPHPAGLAHQWPGVHFETAFEGDQAGFELVAPPLTLHVLVDGERVATLRQPAPGRYRVDGLAPGRHVLRLETASENQAAAHVFGGFLLPRGSRALELPVT